MQTANNSTSTSSDAEKHDACPEMYDLDDRDENSEDKEQETDTSKNEVSEDKVRKSDTVDNDDEIEGKKTDKSDNISK